VDLRAVENPQEWVDLFGPATGHSFLQRWEWGEIKRRNGWRPVRIGAFKGGNLVAGMQILIQRHRPLPFLPAVGIAYVPRGPVGRVEGGVAEALIAAAVDAARRGGASLLRVEPAAANADWVCPALLQLGFGVSDQHVQIRHSAYIDLGRSESEILGGFKSKTRYNTRLAGRRGVVVRAGGEQDLASFFKLTVETGRRDGFAIHDRDYYEAVFKAFGPDDSALFVAAHAGQDLAALMAVKTGREAVYVYGASTSRERRRMPSYAVQWDAMRWARAHGCLRYDLWGMADPENARDPMAGVSRFKHGYNPVPIEHPGTFDLDLSRPLSGLIKALLPVYQQVIANRTQPEPASN
jgi:lipid II:glycine glycyltransferase (peptidoglycan interpeptide bridge formation enzyme)